MTRRIAPIVLMIALLAGALARPLPAAAQSDPPPAAADPAPEPSGPPAPAPADQQAAPGPLPSGSQVAASIPCNSSPFGRVLVIGGEREIFASYRGGSGSARASRALFDRIDLSGPAAIARSFSAAGDDPALQNLGAPAAATLADVDGDGALELVQLFNDGANQLRAATYFRDGSVALRQIPLVGHTQLQAATLSRGANTNDRIVLASRSGTGALSVAVIDPVGVVISNIFRSNTDGRQDPTNLRLAVGDMDKDGSRDDIAVSFTESAGGGLQILALTTNLTPDPGTGSGANFVLRMRQLGFEQLGIGTPMSASLVMADLNGDYKDEIVYAQEQLDQSAPGVSSGIATRAFTLAPDGSRLNAYLSRDESLATAQLTLAAGDTDRDGRDELVRAYVQFGDNSGLRVETLDAEQGNAVVVRNRYAESVAPRNSVSAISADVGDMDKDGFEDIVLGMSDADRQLNILRLEDSELPDAGLSVGGQLRDGSDGRTSAGGLIVRLGDFDNDSVKAHYEAATGSALVCQQVIEPQITAAVFTPPYWKAIQGDQDQLGVIGDSSEQSKVEERSVTTTQSHSVSGYVGFEIDSEVVEFSAKVTAGYERAATTTRSGSTSESETISTSRSNVEGDFVLVENAIYNCYSYQLRQDGAALDGQMRFCDYKGRTVENPSLDAWDLANGQPGAPKIRQWAPVARDWANLALFVKNPPVQSSTAGGADAGRASDGKLSPLPSDTAVTRTASEPSPWWQIDLDAEQPISKVRVWNRSNTACGALGCPAPLANFNVFISSVDPRSISNDPNVLKADPRVKSFAFSGNAADVATLLTLGADLEPVTGRFVRVQLAGAGVLSLAEVQVFGTNQVDPDRYPMGISDPTRGDGFFTVKLFDPRSQSIKEIETRGNLVWNGTGGFGANADVLRNARVGAGGGQTTWSILKTLGSGKSEAVEVENTYRVGVEFDFAGGAFVKATAGVGYEFANSVGEGTVRTLEVQNGFEVGGTVTGFPTRVNGKVVLWPTQCGYGLQPYYYEVTDVSSAGFAHRYIVLDYIVPEASLDRSANMAACKVTRDGGPSLDSNFATGGPGSLFVLTAQGFTAGSTARVELQAPGQPGFGEIASLKMNADGALIFALQIPANAQGGDYRVRITGNGGTAVMSAAGPSQATVARELTLRVERGAEVRDDRDPSAPVIPAPARSFVALPLVRR